MAKEKPNFSNPTIFDTMTAMQPIEMVPEVSDRLEFLFKTGQRKEGAALALRSHLAMIAKKTYMSNKNRVLRSNLEDCFSIAIMVVYEGLLKEYDPYRSKVSTFVMLKLNTAVRKQTVFEVPYQGALAAVPYHAQKRQVSETTKKLRDQFEDAAKCPVRLDGYPDASAGEYGLGSLTCRPDVSPAELATKCLSLIAPLLDTWVATFNDSSQTIKRRDSDVWLASRINEVKGPEIQVLFQIGSRQRLSQILLNMDKVVKEQMVGTPEINDKLFELGFNLG